MARGCVLRIKLSQEKARKKKNDQSRNVEFDLARLDNEF